MKPSHLVAAFSFAAVLLLPKLAWSGPGHDHGGSAHTNAPATTGNALPRFAAESELFELVGVLKGKQITLYLDRAADNSPVTDAKIELEINGKKYQAAKLGADEFEVVLAEVPKNGVLAVTATVVATLVATANATVVAKAGAVTETDLLAGEFDIHGAASVGEPARLRSRKEIAGWAAGGIAVLALLWVVARRVVASRPARLGGAA